MTRTYFGDGRDWFFEHRFGLFIHWGIYALGGWHEQHQFRRRMSRKDYARFIKGFNPTRFNPDAWLDHAEQAGMTYVTITAKHCDGFCLWDSQFTNYKITNTPYGKDVIAMLAEACHRRNFPLCFYYSVPDMHYRHYPNAGRDYELPEPEPDDEPNLDKYLEYVRNQICELCTNYGTIHGIWWDANVLEHEDPTFNHMIRELQPLAVINDRGFDKGDFDVSERDWDKTVDETAVFERPRQGCDSIGHESWGYRKNEHYYSYRYLERQIDRILAKGGNYLLNVGPCPDGTFPAEALDSLKTIGSWYSSVQEAFINTKTVTNMLDNEEVLLTRKGNTLYVHQYEPLQKSGVVLAPLAILPKRAILLNTGEEVHAELEYLPRRVLHDGWEPYLCLSLPVNALTNTVPVIRLDFDQLPDRDISVL